MTTKETSPNFFIVGAHKAGTTSLYAYLRQHPQVFMPERIKEPCYFRGDPGSFEPGPPQLEKESFYWELFKDAKGCKAIGEASTDYFYYSRKSALNIKEHDPRAKIIIILRNPIERAYSNYIWALKEGAESEKSFRQALDLEENRRKKGMGSVWHYKSKGFYASSVRDYLNIFNASQVKVILFEDLKNDANSVCQELFNFLGVDSFCPDTSTVYNVSGVAKIASLQRALNRPSGVMKLGYLLPAKLRKQARSVVRRFNTQNDRARWPQLENDDFAYLLDLYRNDILELQEVIGRDLSAWLK
ncbi:MAG: sulfotransferase [Deltaproteobacteria bacterium]|nr:MAG: sulfotransferase [Deltaproteobacteria bacterium]